MRNERGRRRGGSVKRRTVFWSIAGGDLLIALMLLFVAITR